jgi:Uroporphyrinogen decarboxylase (URO-D)
VINSKPKNCKYHNIVFIEVEINNTMDLEDIVITALDRNEDPPRVPSFVQGIMPYFFEQWDTKYGDELEMEDIRISPTKDITLHCHLGFDSSWCGFTGPGRRAPESNKQKIEEANAKLSPEERADGYHISSRGGLYKTVVLQGYDHSYLVHGTIKTKDQWEDWFESDPWDIVDPVGDPIKKYNESKKQALSGKKPHLLVPSCGLIIEPLLGMVNLGRISYFTRRQPQFFRKLIEFIATPSLQKFKLICESDAQVIIAPDDCAYKGRPILNPKQYKEFIIPYWKKYADMAHKAGKILIMHSDGNLQPYYNDLIEAGLDVHQSLEPLAGNDLGEVLSTYGDRLSFIGNMDCSKLLSFGTAEEVVETTKQTLKAGMSGGPGYMFSPCTDLINMNTLENVEAMMATWKKYSNFPMNIP